MVEEQASNPLVLVVDDDANMRTTVKRMLRGLGLELALCEGPEQALKVFEEREVALLITDFMMPLMDGIELLALVRQTWPGTRTIMMTGTQDMRVAADAVNRRLVDFFVTKPWQDEQFRQLVSQALDAYGKREKSTSPGEGQRFGRYQLIERIATGGMAELWRARMRGSDGFEREVAIKKMLSHMTGDSNFTAMFLDEAHILARLNHGNIVSVLDFGRIEDEFFMALDLVDGPDLRALLRGEQPLPSHLACYVAWQCCQALAHAHQAKDAEGLPLNLVHRDIAPQNLLLSMDGQVRIADFGIARVERKLSRTETGIAKGTLDYMSPEQLAAEAVDARADIYSLGVVLYEMLCGRRPFTGHTFTETLGRITAGKYKPIHRVNSKVDRGLSAIVTQAMRKQRDRRYPDAASMAADLDAHMSLGGRRPEASQLAEWLVGRLAELAKKEES